MLANISDFPPHHRQEARQLMKRKENLERRIHNADDLEKRKTLEAKLVEHILRMNDFLENVEKELSS